MLVRLGFEPTELTERWASLLSTFSGGEKRRPEISLRSQASNGTAAERIRRQSFCDKRDKTCVCLFLTVFSPNSTSFLKTCLCVKVQNTDMLSEDHDKKGL